MTKTRLVATAAFAVALAIGCTKIDSPSTNTVKNTASCFIEGSAEIYVSEALAGQIEDGNLTPSLEQAGIKSIERLFPDAGEWEERHRKAGLHRWYRIEMDDAVLETKAGDLTSLVDGIEICERQRRIKQTANIQGFPFNDPYGKQYQWQILNDGVQYSGYKAGADINVTKVYEQYTGGSSDVIVAVIDGGIQVNHPDLSGVVLPGGKGGSRNFVKNSYTLDDGEHGTHVGGIIGAINNNGTGVCGVAGGTDGKGGVTLMSCEVFGTNDENGDFVSAITWAADYGALICNNSWGYSYESENDAKKSTLPSSMKAAIDYFIENAGCDANGNQTGLMKGGLVVFAAGNENWAYAQPAMYEKVIAVGAIGPDGRRASYSNYGDWVDICAPGGEADRFPSTNNASLILSTNIGSGYVFMAGTSMACPMVSGVAALILSVHGGPGYTNTDLWDALINTANSSIVPASDNIGPLVDAFAAVSYGNVAPVLKDGAEEAICGRELGEDDDLEVVFRLPGETLTLDGTQIFYDADGDALTYTLTTDTEDVVEFSASGNELVLTALGTGSTHCVLKATDSSKASVSIEFDLAVFNDADGPAIYPNPVANSYFMVAPGEKQEIKVEILGQTGVNLYTTTATASIFDPLRVEMLSFAAGKYVVRTTYGGKTYNTNIVKL